MIRIGICGYGNLGKGVEAAIQMNKDMELIGVFSRRNPKDIMLQTKGISVYSMEDILDFKDKIDVMILCGGSATDLPTQTVELGKHFNVIDSFDTHANILNHYKNVDKACTLGGKVGIISVGWDPGMFSINRLYAQSILPNGMDYTFWGKGVSQGHSDAIRRIEGVVDARQYTIPIEEALKSARSGENKPLTTREKHLRECFVVAEKESDQTRIEKTIKEMPNYFADYDTIVHFISLEELKQNHSGIPHGGFVIRSGKTGMNQENTHVIEYSLKIDSNPEFTGAVMVAYARACYRFYHAGKCGCFTVFDVSPSDLSILSKEEQLGHIL